ncbi:hypothetical protein RFI_24637, partial [Reticulomyxa filosa]
LELETLLYEFRELMSCFQDISMSISEHARCITHIMIGTVIKIFDDQSFLPMQSNEFNDIQFGYIKILLFQFIRNSDRAVVDSVQKSLEYVLKAFFMYTLYNKFKKNVFFLIKNFDVG